MDKKPLDSLTPTPPQNGSADMKGHTTPKGWDGINSLTPTPPQNGSADMKGHTTPKGWDGINKTSSDGVISWEESLAILDRLCSATTPVETETLNVYASLGRITAEAATSRFELPPFNKAAMDGYALLVDDQRDEYDVIEHVQAGQTANRIPMPGETVRIMTGAPLPEGCDRVVPWENTDNDMNRVKVHRQPSKTNVCMKGEDVRTGDVILPAGSLITPVALANLTACGVRMIEVRQPVRIAVLTTGDEIVDLASYPEETLEPGMIVDANGPMLEGLIAAGRDMELIERRIVPDDLKSHVDAIEQAASNSDLLILTGGVSAGDYDFVSAALQEAGFTIHFDQVSVQPGKPLTLATRANCIVCGLPGNPISVLNAFHLNVVRIARHLQRRPIEPISFALPMGCDFQRRRAGRASFIPAKLNPNGSIETIPYHGSAHLLALHEADGVFLVPQGTHKIAQGDQIQFFPRFS
jgi:molybdopterin molybdotransferase